MDIGQRILEAVRRSESTGTIVKDYQGLSVDVEKLNGFNNGFSVYFFYRGLLTVLYMLNMSMKTDTG